MKAIQNKKKKQTENDIKDILASYCDEQINEITKQTQHHLGNFIWQAYHVKEKIRKHSPIMFFSEDAFRETSRAIIYAYSLAYYIECKETNQSVLIDRLQQIGALITPDIIGAVLDFKLMKCLDSFFDHFFLLYDLSELEHFRCYQLLNKTAEYYHTYKPEKSDIDLFQLTWLEQEKSHAEYILHSVRRTDNFSFPNTHKLHCMVVLQNYIARVADAMKSLTDLRSASEQEKEDLILSSSALTKQIYIDDDYKKELENTFFGFIDPSDRVKARELINGKEVSGKVLFREKATKLIDFFLYGYRNQKIFMNQNDLRDWIVKYFTSLESKGPKDLTIGTIKRYFENGITPDPFRKHQRAS